MKKKTVIYIVVTIALIGIATFIMIRNKRKHQNPDRTPLQKEGDKTPDIKIDDPK